jgi:hypothetical protein
MLGLLFGRSRKEQGSPAGHAAKDRTTVMAALLHDKFATSFGSVTCKEIHGRLLGRPYDLRDAHDKVAFHEAGAHDDPDKCCDVVGTASKWTVLAILEELQARGLTLADIDALVKDA